MKRDLERRLEQLEQVAGPDPEPPQVWICEGGVCHKFMEQETITLAELESRPQTGHYPTIIILRDDDAAL